MSVMYDMMLCGGLVVHPAAAKACAACTTRLGMVQRGTDAGILTVFIPGAHTSRVLWAGG